MPLSAKVYEETLAKIARKRYQKQPIRAEINVVDSDETISNDDIQSALCIGDKDSVQFWENNVSLFGAYDNTTHIRAFADVNGEIMESFKQSIRNNDVMREKHWLLRTNDKGETEHLFALACRFALDGPNNDIFVYAMHIESSKTVKLEERTCIWSALSDMLISRPEQYGGVPDDIHFKHLCEMDGWKS